jgi:hypothetical protein
LHSPSVYQYFWHYLCTSWCCIVPSPTKSPLLGLNFMHILNQAVLVLQVFKSYIWLWIPILLANGNHSADPTMSCPLQDPKLCSCR